MEAATAAAAAAAVAAQEGPALALEPDGATQAHLRPVPLFMWQLEWCHSAHANSHPAVVAKGLPAYYTHMDECSAAKKTDSGQGIQGSHGKTNGGTN